MDLDNDGRADLYAVNGSTFEEKGSPLLLERSSPQIFWNAGQRYFDLAPRAGPALQVPFVGRGGTSGDLDGDGDCDLVFVRHGETPLVLRNDLENPGNFLVVEARGSMPNPFAYGALVTVESGGRTQVQQVGSKVSYLSSGPHRMHFGLGSASQADKVIVRFPSGKTVTRTRVLAGRRLVVKEVDPRGLGTLMDKARDAGPEAAIRVYREILDLDPAHENALYALAQLVEPEEAIGLCGRVIAVAPRVPRGYLLRARLRSDPSNPAQLDLEHALVDVERARRYNRDETGGALQAGRILILAGDYRAAAEILTRVQSNPRAAALGALARLRLGETEAAEALLARHAGPKADVSAEEGDSPGKRMGERDLLARLLELPDSRAWELSPLPDGGEFAPPAPPAAVRVTPYDFDEAAAWALDPPDRCEQAPPGTTSTLEADLDGDGDLDLIAVCGADDPAAPLPWWALLREGDSYRPVRGTLPAKGWGVGAVAAVDIDHDGRSELILQTGGMLASDRGGCWIASLKKTP